MISLVRIIRRGLRAGVATALIGTASVIAPANGSADTYTYNAWAPSGLGQLGLFSGNTNGTAWEPVWTGPISWPVRVEVSPDGNQLAMETGVGGTDPQPGWGLWTQDVNGDNRKILLQDTEDTAGRCCVAWNPDGTKLVFAYAPQGGTSSPFYLYRIDADGTNMTRLTFVGDEYMPTYSPSGDQLAWVADWGGQNHIVIGDGDAQNSRNLGVGSQPDFSPDGRYIVFSTPRADGQWWIAIMRTDGTELRYQRPGRNPSWSPDHHVVVFENDGNIYKMTPWDPASMALVAAGDAYQTPADPAFRQASIWYPRDSSIQDPPGPPAATDNEMLEWYTPRLRFDALESYRADSPATLTDTYVSGSTANYLKRSTQKIVAASDPALRYDDLSLNFLAPTYPGKAGSAATSDFIDENNSYLADAQRMHARSAYANRVVGRVVRYTDAIILQYWLWYYYNPKTYLTIGAHEGDWEMVQVRLDRATLQPTVATFSQHNGGETCGWLHVERDANNHPIVYVAEGSHASYFSAGYHFNGGADDTAGGDGEEVARPTLIDVTTSPNWLRWPGHWGGSDSSPAGPMQQGGLKWSDPQAWGYGADACSEESRVIDGAAAASARRRRAQKQGAVSVNTKKMPEIRARRSGNTIIIDYRSATDSRLPATLLTSLRTRRAGLTPLTMRTTIRRPSGVVRRTIPERMGRVSVYVAVEFPGHGRTKVMRVPLR